MLKLLSPKEITTSEPAFGRQAACALKLIDIDS
jgi:hypothetical protein